MDRFLRMIRGALPELVNDALVLAGLAMVFYGLHQWWPPLAWLIGGAGLTAYGLIREWGSSIGE